MISFQKAEIYDCKEIQQMQISAFAELLRKYRDIDTNPACESLDKIKSKMKSSTYYFILNNSVKVGVIRIIQNQNSCRISPIFILPEFQNRGYAQEALIYAEKLYPKIKYWSLDTIKQEQKLYYLYSKSGYNPTGKEYNIKDDMTIVFFEKKIL